MRIIAVYFFHRLMLRQELTACGRTPPRTADPKQITQFDLRIVASGLHVSAGNRVINLFPCLSRPSTLSVSQGSSHVGILR